MWIMILTPAWAHDAEDHHAQDNDKPNCCDDREQPPKFAPGSDRDQKIAWSDRRQKERKATGDRPISCTNTVSKRRQARPSPIII